MANEKRKELRRRQLEEKRAFISVKRVDNSDILNAITKALNQANNAHRMDLVSSLKKIYKTVEQNGVTKKVKQVLATAQNQLKQSKVSTR